MKKVTKEEFNQYFQDKEYKITQGECMHSNYFEIDGENVGYMETSSWGAPDVYMLKYGTVNSETITLVGQLIKNKL